MYLHGLMKVVTMMRSGLTVRPAKGRNSCDVDDGGEEGCNGAGVGHHLLATAHRRPRQEPNAGAQLMKALRAATTKRQGFSQSQRNCHSKGQTPGWYPDRRCDRGEQGVLWHTRTAFWLKGWRDVTLESVRALVLALMTWMGSLVQPAWRILLVAHLAHSVLQAKPSPSASPQSWHTHWPLPPQQVARGALPP